MNRTQTLITAALATPALFLFMDAAVTAPRANHHNGQQLLGRHFKADGNFPIDQKGGRTISVHVENGMVVGVDVQQPGKIDMPVTKVKSSQRMAKLETEGVQMASFNLGQAPSLGMVYIGFAFLDEGGDEHVYWFPDGMVQGGDAGALDYAAAK